MAITTLAGVKAGLIPSAFFTKQSAAGINLPETLWSRAGNPVAGAYDTTLNGVTLTAPQTGAIPWNNPASGNSYLARLQAQLGALNFGKTTFFLTLCDRLWHNGGFDVTSISAQNITSPTWPSRDELGGTTGQGVLLGLEISASVGAGVPTITVAYTDSDNAAQSSTSIYTGVASSIAASFYPIGLAAASRGVKSVQSLTLSQSWTSGTINLVAYRVIATLDPAQPYLSNAIDAVTGGMPRIYDGSVLFFLADRLSVQGSISGKLDFAQG